MAKSTKKIEYLHPKTDKSSKGQKYSGARNKEDKSHNTTTTTDTTHGTLASNGPVNGADSTSGGSGNRGGSTGSGSSAAFMGVGKAGASLTPFNFNQEQQAGGSPQITQELQF